MYHDVIKSFVMTGRIQQLYITEVIPPYYKQDSGEKKRQDMIL
jgi:hypothetical protein